MNKELEKNIAEVKAIAASKRMVGDYAVFTLTQGYISVNEWEKQRIFELKSPKPPMSP